ncbi:MAG TPA: GntR family transcriptional regulator, partial [Citreicella sp.]|nr:GntR family transcriptional regulator [Citreicella sp.]
TPVREALNRLAAEGFLDLHPRRGAMVKPLTGTELRDLHEVRLMVESHAVRRICREARPVPALLSDLCDQHEAVSADNLLACVDLNRRFHQAIVAAAGNTVLVQVFDNLQANLMRMSMLSLQSGLGKTARIEAEHRDLITALQTHDEAAALALLDRHLQPLPQLFRGLPGQGPVPG